MSVTINLTFWEIVLLAALAGFSYGFCKGFARGFGTTLGLWLMKRAER